MGFGSCLRSPFKFIVQSTGGVRCLRRSDGIAASVRGAEWSQTHWILPGGVSFSSTLGKGTTEQTPPRTRGVAGWIRGRCVLHGIVLFLDNSTILLVILECQGSTNPAVVQTFSISPAGQPAGRQTR